MSDLNKNLDIVAKSSIILFFGIIFSKIFSYLYRIIIAREFGPQFYGYFSLAFMVSGWFVVFSLLGLDEGVTRYIAYYRGKNELKKIKKIFSFSFILVLFTSIFLGILMFVSSSFFAINVFHDPSLIIFLKFFSLTIPLFAISQLLLGTLRAYEKVSEYSLLYNIIHPGIKVLFLGLFILLGVNYNSINFSIILGYLVLVILSYYYCKKYLSHLFVTLFSTDLSFIKKEAYLNYSIPLMFAGVVGSVFGWADTFFIGYFKTASDVGLYNAALPLAMLLILPSFLFVQLFFPIINKEYSKKNFSNIKELSKQVGKWIFIFNIPLLFFSVFFPGYLINFFFGSKYILASISLIFLSIGFFILAQSSVSISLLSMNKKSFLIFLDISSALILDIVLCIILVPKEAIFSIANTGGLVGAALATMISYIFYSILTFSQVYYYFKIVPIRRKMISVFISGLIAGIILLSLRNLFPVSRLYSVLLGILFMLIYILFLFLTKSLDSSDILILKTNFKTFSSKLFFNNPHE